MSKIESSEKRKAKYFLFPAAPVFYVVVDFVLVVVVLVALPDGLVG